MVITTVHSISIIRYYSCQLISTWMGQNRSEVRITTHFYWYVQKIVGETDFLLKVWMYSIPYSTSFVSLDP